MRLLIDESEPSLVKNAYDFFPIDGVTTNPTTLAKIGGNPFDTLRKILEIISNEDELHVQVVSHSADEIITEAKHIANILGPAVCVDIPAVPEGFKAMEILAYNTDVHFAAMAIYTPMQAFIAAECGALYVIPYVNQIDNFGYNGIETAKKIKDYMLNNKMETEIIAADFKNSQQLIELGEYGIDAAAISSKVLDNLVKNPAIDAVLNKFIADFETSFEKGKTMLDFK